MKRIISSPEAPAAVGPYSQAIETDGALYVSGQLPIDPRDGSMPDGVEAQTHRSLRNLQAILHEAGYTTDDIVKTTVLLADIADFGRMNAVYAEYFHKTLPARVCYQVAALPKAALVEIDCIAAKK